MKQLTNRLEAIETCFRPVRPVKVSVKHGDTGKVLSRYKADGKPLHIQLGVKDMSA